MVFRFSHVGFENLYLSCICGSFNNEESVYVYVHNEQNFFGERKKPPKKIDNFQSHQGRYN